MKAIQSKQLKRIVFITLCTILVFSSLPVQAQTSTPAYPVTVYLFWGEGCPHCAEAKPYLADLQNQYPQISLISYEIYYDQDNLQLFTQMADKAGMDRIAVPTMFIGPYHIIGYSEQIQSEIVAAVTYCIQNRCTDAGQGIINAVDEIMTTPMPTTLAPTSDFLQTEPPLAQVLTSVPTESTIPMQSSLHITLPWIGTIDLSLQSITLATILIALVDGFNPCSLWVLSMLLALTLHTGSRKKMLIIGIVFLTVTAFIYALFIAGLFSVLKIVSFMGWIQVGVALIAFFFGLVNIKDYFWYKEGLSFTISDEKKPGIYQSIRRVIDASQSTWGLIGATVVLAAGVSLVEFSCTAGFPVLWTNLLTAQDVEPSRFILLLIMYMVIYQVDEMAIFFSAVVTLKATRLEEKSGRVLKLMGGMLMLTLSAVMLFNPALMNSLKTSMIIFGAAILATLLILFIHRIMLPIFGIRIGTEFNEKQ